MGAKKLALSGWMKIGLGSLFRGSCKWEVGGASGIITDDSETLSLEKVESEVVRGTCGTADRGGVS